MGMLFGIAHWASKRERQGRSLVSNPYVYALSLAVYCTAWTYYGSVGRAASNGIGFLPIYLGPTILAPLWLILLRKIVVISKAQRLTSIADFLSARYGKSTTVGVLATWGAVIGIVPYVSIQLKAIAESYHLLAGQAAPAEQPLWNDSAIYITLALALFAILFGTRKLDPNERHEGLVAAIAFESLFKLAAFLAVGFFVSFMLFDGWGSLFETVSRQPDLQHLIGLDDELVNEEEWFWLLFLSMSAVLLLPRQFHVAVVETRGPGSVRQASWMFPLYLLLINVFVLPIAAGGLLLQGENASPDTYVLSLPLAHDKPGLALFAALGGFSAATSMVIVSIIALSIMISNNLVLPLLVNTRAIRQEGYAGLSRRLLAIRRLSIALVLLLAYSYLKLVGEAYPLVSIGLISFCAIAQFAPLVLGALYWKRATKTGAVWGLTAGLLLWAYTLPLPTLAEVGLLPATMVKGGLLGIPWLNPYALFGMDSLGPVAHSAFWSLTFNTLFYVLGSLLSRPGRSEVAQADFFVDVYKYAKIRGEREVMRRQARMHDIRLLLTRFLGEERTEEVLQDYARRREKPLKNPVIAQPDLVNLAEVHLAGTIGAASARILISSVAREAPISLEEMLEILEQTQEIVAYSKALEQKSAELERTTKQLKAANEQLKELDRLKADFITTVTHELRTPITSVKTIARILQDHSEQMAAAKYQEFLGIMVSESERIGRLINQVLDLEKIRSPDREYQWETLALDELVNRARMGMQQLLDQKGIALNWEVEGEQVLVRGDYDKLTQVIVNLLSNAIKFCPGQNGAIRLQVQARADSCLVAVKDNGIGISAQDQAVIFDKFTQLTDKAHGKPAGSGLGLHISRIIVEHHGGEIWVESSPGSGAAFYIRLPRLQKAEQNLGANP